MKITSWALAVAAFVWMADAGAQTIASESQTVSGFKFPEYDEQGNLKAQIFGDLAKVLPDGIIEITELKMEIYDKGAVDVKVTSPKCTFDQKSGKAGSDSDVRIARENVVVTGKGFFWSSKNERFQIFKNAKVVLKDVRSTIKTGEEE